MLVPTDGSSHILNMSLQTTLDGNPSYPSMTACPGVTIPADGAWHQINVMRYNMSNNATIRALRSSICRPYRRRATI